MQLLTICCASIALLVAFGPRQALLVPLIAGSNPTAALIIDIHNRPVRTALWVVFLSIRLALRAITFLRAVRVERSNTPTPTGRSFCDNAPRPAVPDGE